MNQITATTARPDPWDKDEPTAPIDILVGNLKSTAGELDAALAELLSRIRTVLRPDETEQILDAQIVDGADSPLACQLIEISAHLGHLIDAAKAATRRVQL